jgi:hypothetical protein
VGDLVLRIAGERLCCSVICESSESESSSETGRRRVGVCGGGEEEEDCIVALQVCGTDNGGYCAILWLLRVWVYYAGGWGIRKYSWGEERVQRLL